jgi:hypothetical protein
MNMGSSPRNPENGFYLEGIAVESPGAWKGERNFPLVRRGGYFPT